MGIEISINKLCMTIINKLLSYLTFVLLISCDNTSSLLEQARYSFEERNYLNCIEILNKLDSNKIFSNIDVLSMKGISYFYLDSTFLAKENLKLAMENDSKDYKSIFLYANILDEEKESGLAIGYYLNFLCL